MTDFRAYYMLQGSIEFQLFLKVVRNMTRQIGGLVRRITDTTNFTVAGNGIIQRLME